MQSERITSHSGTVKWQSPSNIALVKYWGKHGNQLPNNPSLSMTLHASVTITEVEYMLKENGTGLSLDFTFEGKAAPDFESRIANFLKAQSGKYQFLNKVHLKIQSSNTFPHSSGIASSASAFSALAVCIVNMNEAIVGNKYPEKTFYQEASELARLGSGSAGRSLYNGYVVWGKHQSFPNYSNDYAVPVASDIHPVFENYYDAILIVSGEKKKVGSSAGHALMERHPFAQARYAQANQNLVLLHKVLETGDLAQFIEIVENEALSLHGLMMSSTPGYMLMKQNTLLLIEKIRSFRSESKIPVCFTLDAGPNIHLLYPQQYREKVIPFIKSELLSFCDNRRWIDDKMGKGPVQIINKKIRLSS